LEIILTPNPFGVVFNVFGENFNKKEKVFFTNLLINNIKNYIVNVYKGLYSRFPRKKTQRSEKEG